MTNLTLLNLTRNSLTECPAVIGDLCSLEKLDLSCNKLPSVPREIKKLKKLKKLDLEDNLIESIPPEIGQLNDLEHLRLCRNKLTTLPPEIGNLIKLKILHLSFNNLTSLPPEIRQLSNLKRLVLETNHFATLPSEIGQLKHLKELVVTYNQLTSLPPEIGGLDQLEQLTLTGNQLTILPAEIGQLKKLDRIVLQNNRLTNLPSEIGQLENLIDLYVQNNQLSNLPPEIGNLGKLASLDLVGNNITSLPNEILALPTTASIDLERNPLSQHVIGNLQQTVNSPVYVGPQIYFSIYEKREETRPLQELLDELFEAAGSSPFELKNLCSSEVNKENLSLWLSRLAEISDYKTKRKELSVMIYKALKKAEAKGTFREIFWNCIQNAHETCGDRMALSVIYLDLQFHIEKHKNDLSKLAYLLGHGSWALSELEKIAGNKARSLKFVDEIEVYLAYPIYLKKELRLPIVLDTMLYFTCSSVTQNDLQNAAELIKPSLSNRNSYCEFLASNDTWQKALAEAKSEEFSQIQANKKATLERAASTEDYNTIQQTFQEELSLLTNEVFDQIELPPFLKMQ